MQYVQNQSTLPRKMQTRLISRLGNGLLIEKAATLGRSAEANNFLLFEGKLVVVRDFLANTNWLLRVDDNFLLPLDGDHFSIAIRLQKRRRGTLVCHGRSARALISAHRRARSGRQCQNAFALAYLHCNCG